MWVDMCVGNLKGRERGIEWWCLGYVKGRKRDRMGGYAGMLCERETERDRDSVCVCRLWKGREEQSVCVCE